MVTFGQGLCALKCGARCGGDFDLLSVLCVFFVWCMVNRVYGVG